MLDIKAIREKENLEMKKFCKQKNKIKINKKYQM